MTTEIPWLGGGNTTYGAVWGRHLSKYDVGDFLLRFQLKLEVFTSRVRPKLAWPPEMCACSLGGLGFS